MSFINSNSASSSSSATPPLSGLQFQQPRKYFGTTEDSAPKNNDLKKSSIFFTTPSQLVVNNVQPTVPKLEFSSQKFEFKRKMTSPLNDSENTVPTLNFKNNQGSTTGASSQMIRKISLQVESSNKPAMYSSQIVGNSSNFKPGGLSALGRTVKAEDQDSSFTTEGSNKRNGINPFATIDTNSKTHAIKTDAPKGASLAEGTFGGKSSSQVFGYDSYSSKPSPYRNQSLYTNITQIIPTSVSPVFAMTPSAADPSVSTFAKKKGVRFDEVTTDFNYKTSQEQEDSSKNSKLPLNATKAPLTKNDFFIGKKLGKGQFGEVFLVKHKVTGFVCAMKTIKKQVIREQKVQDQIVRQLKIQFYLDDPNIVKLYGFFHDQEYVYLLLEICCDGQLYDVLKRERRISEERASEVVKQICVGIDHIHRQRIIHRDIKPENVIMHCGVAKICDFGWAVHRGNTLRTTYCGTPLYTPPEMIRGEEYDEGVDIWSIGILTYELIVGRIPFKIYCETDIQRILTDEITFPEHVDISENTKEFILRILKRNKEERWDIDDLLGHSFLKLKPKMSRTYEFGDLA